MSEVLKKIFSVLSAMPAFTNLFKKASQTGRIDPVETLNALSSLSPSTKKCADVAMNTVQRGGDVSDVAQALTNMGEIEVMGQRVNTKTLTQDLRKYGGTIGGILANWLDNVPNQSEKDIVDFGNTASDLNNWSEIIKNH